MAQPEIATGLRPPWFGRVSLLRRQATDLNRNPSTSTQRNDWPAAPFIPSRYPLSGRGAHDRNRTGDLVLTKDVLYRLSYVGRTFNTSPAGFRLERVMGIEPTSTAWKAEVLPLNYTRSARRF